MRTHACRTASYSRRRTKKGFTLIEVILVAVVIAILAGISLPNVAQSLRGAKLKTTANTIERMARYARGMAIIHDQTMAILIDPTSKRIYAGELKAESNQTDGRLDQTVLKRLGYTEEEPPNKERINIRMQRALEPDIELDSFTLEANALPWDRDNVCFIEFYPSGQCEAFSLELIDANARKLQLSSDPITGKVRSRYL
jgi:prepilin-type N-terminal cleavage/methylation domain-containing protein